MKTYYINAVDFDGVIDGCECDYQHRYIALFDSNEWKGEGNFCGYYATEMYLNTTMLAFFQQEGDRGSIYDPHKKASEVHRCRIAFEYVTIGSGMWEMTLEAENDEDAIRKFENLEFTRQGGESEQMLDYNYGDYDDYEEQPLPESMKTLPQYHFDRQDFCKVFDEVFTQEEIIDLDVTCGDNRHFDEYSLFRWEDEFYILHRNSGILINWYKHLGRTNTCNKADFTLDDLKQFLIRLKGELKFYKVI